MKNVSFWQLFIQKSQNVSFWEKCLKMDRMLLLTNKKEKIKRKYKFVLYLNIRKVKYGQNIFGNFLRKSNDG